MKPPTAAPTSEALLPWLRRFHKLTVVVWADLVADEYIAGEIARVSREAPVLILKRRSRAVLPGGGANAAANLAALGVRVRLIGAVGQDEPGDRLLEALAGAGVEIGAVLRLRRRLTPTKTRILASQAHTRPQQVIRLDHEPTAVPERELAARCAARALRAARGAQALLASDYGYGTITPTRLAQVAAERSSLPVCVDARYQIATYRGMAAATPNESELEAALHVTVDGDRTALERSGRRLLRGLACRHLLVTRGRDGMALFEPGRPTLHLPVFGSDQARDVTGAGDTVIAVFTAALGAGAPGPVAAALANCAGGLVVMKPGTATTSVAEMEAALAAAQPA